MAAASDSHKGQIEECKNIFPTWAWLVGIIFGSIVILATCLYSYTKAETMQDNTMDQHEIRIQKVEKAVVVYEDMDKKLDILINRKSTERK